MQYHGYDSRRCAASPGNVTGFLSGPKKAESDMLARVHEMRVGHQLHGAQVRITTVHKCLPSGDTMRLHATMYNNVVSPEAPPKSKSF